MEDNGITMSGSGFPQDETQSNCTFLSHCKLDILSDSSITCEFVWDIITPVSKYSPYVAVIEAVFFLISFFWNLFIIISFIARRNMLKEPASIYLLNVATTDLLLSIFVVFQCFITESAGGFIVGSTDIIRCGLCKYLGFMIMFLVSSTLHTLAILSFDRFFLLLKPLTYKQYFNWKKALIIVIFIWLLSLGLAIPPIVGLGEYSFNTVIANCHPAWSGKSAAGINNLNYIIFIGTEALLPIILLIITNIWSCRIVLRVLRNRHDRHKSIQIYPQSKARVDNKEDVEYNKKQLQLVKVFGALFIAHICCWTPVLTVLVVAIVIGPSSIPLEVFVAGWILFLTNPVVHPIIETYFIKYLRTCVNKAKKRVRESFRLHGHASSLRNSENHVKISESSNEHQNCLEVDKKAVTCCRKERFYANQIPVLQ